MPINDKNQLMTEDRRLHDVYTGWWRQWGDGYESCDGMVKRWGQMQWQWCNNQIFLQFFETM